MTRPLVNPIVDGQRNCIRCHKIKSLDCYRWVPSKNHYRADCRECEKLARQRYRKTPKWRYSKLKEDAKARNYSVDLTFAEFVEFQNKNCSYCGGSLDRIRLDRVDNSIGYQLGNVVPCCWECNLVKGSRSRQEFINHCLKVSAFCKEE